uniref:Chitin-binding type-2 domain-containing protein n=1 Tax=Caenorhabditis japonica TaxID=281687 RepID=A0A8R1I0Q7_CAEJA
MLLSTSLFILATLTAVFAKNKNQECYNDDRKPNGYWTTSYYVCKNYRWELTYCPPNYYVNPVTVRCTYSNGPPTTPTPRPTVPSQICRPGSRIPDLFDNTKYLECRWNGLEWVVRYCQPYSVFNEKTGICVSVEPTTRYTTPPTTQTTTPYYGACTESGGAAGYKPDINSCFHYYQCASGTWIQRPCPAGTVWNQQLLTCDHNRGQCRPVAPHTTPQPYTTRIATVIVKKH